MQRPSLVIPLPLSGSVFGKAMLRPMKNQDPYRDFKDGLVHHAELISLRSQQTITDWEDLFHVFMELQAAI